MQTLTLIRDDKSELFSIDIIDRIIIGRAGTCDITIGDDPLVSKKHCEILINNGKLYIKDLGSTNHTYCEDMTISTTSHEEIFLHKKYKIGKYRYEIKLIGEFEHQDEKSESGTVFYKQMMDDFKRIASTEDIISTKDLLMNDRSIANSKFNEAIKKWKQISASKYVLDLICNNISFSFLKRDRVYEEVDLYSSIESLSVTVKEELINLASSLIDYIEERLKQEDAEKYISITTDYINPEAVAKKIMSLDESFILYVLVPIFNIDEEQLGYILKHVLKRKGVDFYNADEFLLWVSSKVKSNSRIGLLCELKELYTELKKDNTTFVKEINNEADNDVPGTVYVGYNAEDLYLDELEGIINISELSSFEIIKNMLVWYINIEKPDCSSATREFEKLYDEVNELYAAEIADLKVLKKNIKEFEPDLENNSGSRGTYNVSQKYDGTGKILICYSTSSDIVLKMDKNLFVSSGRFNRVDGTNYFSLVEDITIKSGSGQCEAIVKCTSESPFQMAKLRKKGTASIAEKDTIVPLEEVSCIFEKIDVKNKPICIFFDQFKSTGDIRDYLYSEIDRKDLMDEWFYNKETLSIDVEQLNAEWFLDTKISREIIDNFASSSGYEQRCVILMLLFLKFCKGLEYNDMSNTDLLKKFTYIVNSEMHELRFEGINYGNPFDCLLCYLLLTNSPVDNLRFLYKEFCS